jgi:hypothetical protein
VQQPPERKHRSPIGDDGHQPGRPIPPPLPETPQPRPQQPPAEGDQTGGGS